MSLPAVTITERDGALGVLPAGQRLAAFVGQATSGPVNQPATFARTQDITALFTGGPAVEAACYFVETFRKPCVFVRAAAGSGTGAVSEVDSVATGTSAVTVVASPTPHDDFEVVLRFIEPGVKGTAGATYELSFDGGRNWGPETALGTAATIAVTEAGFSFALGTGDFDAGDTHSVVVTAPVFDGTTIVAAMEALKLTAVQWEGCNIIGPIADSTVAGTIETKFEALFAAGKKGYWMGQVRMPDPDETEAEYLDAMNTAFAGFSTKYGGVAAGATKLSSAVSGRSYRRPLLFSAAALQASVSEEVNIADVNLGALAGVVIRDSNGNPDEHDEAIYPGLDDARFITARTHEDYPGGVYITRPRLFSAPGSDFQIIPYRRVLNLGHIALRAYFVKRLNSPILVDAVTGFILEREAQEIELGAKAAMRGLIMAKPKASAIDFILSRTDNLLSTKTLTGQGRVTPFGYPEFIDLELSLFNPVNAVAA